MQSLLQVCFWNTLPINNGEAFQTVLPIFEEITVEIVRPAHYKSGIVLETT